MQIEETQKQYASLLDAYLASSGEVPIPYVLAEDVYAIEHGLMVWRQSKAIDLGPGLMRFPVLSAGILHHHYRKGKVKNASTKEARMDLSMAIANRMCIRIDNKLTPSEVHELIGVQLAEFGVQTIIVHQPENLGLHHSDGIPVDPWWEIKTVIDQAALWNCRVILSGGWKLWWALQTRAERESPKMELFIPKTPRHLEDSFFEEMKEKAIKGAYGYDPGEGLSRETAQAIWDAVDGNREKALYLLHNLIIGGIDDEKSAVTTERVRQLTHGTCV